MVFFRLRGRADTILEGLEDLGVWLDEMVSFHFFMCNKDQM